jgi:ornithine decarboxylase
MLSNARFILSKSKVIEKYNEVKKLADVVSYSYKTNFDVGKILEKETLCMFSVYSIESLSKIKNPERVWFFAQAWNDKELDLLFDRAVNKFIVDNETDLYVLLNYIQKKNKRINLLLRMKLKEHTIHTGKHYV